MKALAVDGDDLFAGGQSSREFGENFDGVMKWSGNVWQSMGTVQQSLGTGGGGFVQALAKADGILYAGGSFQDSVGGIPARNVAKWDGSGWKRLRSGTNGWVAALVTHQGDLYAAGSFTSRRRLRCESCRQMGWR